MCTLLGGLMCKAKLPGMLKEIETGEGILPVTLAVQEREAGELPSKLTGCLGKGILPVSPAIQERAAERLCKLKWYLMSSHRPGEDSPWRRSSTTSPKLWERVEAVRTA